MAVKLSKNPLKLPVKKLTDQHVLMGNALNRSQAPYRVLDINFSK